MTAFPALYRFQFAGIDTLSYDMAVAAVYLGKIAGFFHDEEFLTATFPAFSRLASHEISQETKEAHNSSNSFGSFVMM